ncbi:glutathione peroxidase [Micromonospora parathelypteridis]|uniref:Glutathione peroxidase n=1 Tax=Micromonospora parathelypteridis TaxID=1839617 RepID=A0A840VUE8_9ACTN|nr:glutathione peroxidase [Micromonospora parathelypteridis]MBB5476638.1 glutathione peroxidase [Micromonospora parathelypteridis]GGO16239.1 glutathione peroxidase [Micromonospora parathelypteridis]
MTVFDIPIDALNGGPADLARYRGKALLVVNVASRCGLTPQYAGLQTLADSYADRGLVVLGVPCNQFAGQEPGSAAEISDFCQVNYGVTFPLTEKVDVNGPDRHPLYAALVETPDADGHTGDVRWNFEKFLVAPDGSIAARFAPTVEPDADDLRAAIEKALPTPA